MRREVVTWMRDNHETPKYPEGDVLRSLSDILKFDDEVEGKPKEV